MKTSSISRYLKGKGERTAAMRRRPEAEPSSGNRWRRQRRAHRRSTGSRRRHCGAAYTGNQEITLLAESTLNGLAPDRVLPLQVELTKIALLPASTIRSCTFPRLSFREYRGDGAQQAGAWSLIRSKKYAVPLAALHPGWPVEYSPLTWFGVASTTAHEADDYDPNLNNCNNIY
jgi:hypothetical protein